MAGSVWGRIFAVSVFKDENCLIQNRLRRINPDIVTFHDLLIDLNEEHNVLPYDGVKVTVSKGKTADSANTMTVLVHDDIALVTEFDKSLNSITFSLSSGQSGVESNQSEEIGTVDLPSSSRSMNEVLIWPTKHNLKFV